MAICPKDLSVRSYQSRSSASAGGGNSIRTSKRRQTARSSISGWFVAQTTTQWLGIESIFRRSEETTRLISPVSCVSDRSLPTLSNSSKNRTHGVCDTYSTISCRREAVSPR
jgi:hypothetical protein